jgi:hypothetical protein
MRLAERHVHHVSSVDGVPAGSVVGVPLTRSMLFELILDLPKRLQPGIASCPSVTVGGDRTKLREPH